MKIPDKFPALKAPKNGYEWVARGLAWRSDKPADFAIINNDVVNDVWCYCDGGDSVGMHNLYYVEEVLIARLPIEKQIVMAKDMVGKTFLWKNRDMVTIKSWHVTNERSYTKHSGMVVDEVTEFGVSVYVLDTDGAQYPVTCEHITEYVKPSYKEVVINKTYTAKVYADKIEVGCQTFPIAILSELLDLHKKLKES